MKAIDFSKPVSNFISPAKTVVSFDHSIEEALDSLRKRQIDEKIVYFYVIDDSGKLRGVVPARNLLLKKPDLKIKDVMESDVISVKEGLTLEEAIEILKKYNLLAIPVVDEHNKLLGLVDVRLCLEESFDVVKARHRQEIFQLIGINLGEGKSSYKNYALRMPWLICNIFGGVMCAVISKYYSGVLSKVLLLAMFIPLVLSLNESISMQSMTHSLQILRSQNTSWRQIFSQVLAESKVVFLLSLTSGLGVGFISLFWGGGVLPGLTIALGIFSTIFVSAAIGTSVPIWLHAKQLDPKVASGPVVLMAVDIITTAIYLSLAAWWL